MTTKEQFLTNIAHFDGPDSPPGAGEQYIREIIAEILEAIA